MKKLFLLAVSAIILTLSACKDHKSYAELLTDENQCVNAFLVDQRVCHEVPLDSVFEWGPDAPYYRMDEDGNVYMQVINPGTPSLRPTKGQLIYFRFTRYNLKEYSNGRLPAGSGNAEDFSMPNTSFRFDDFSLPSTQQWGTGIQIPLHYLGIDCEVNIIIKSQFGITDETANVVPYLYNVRYYKAQI